MNPDVSLILPATDETSSLVTTVEQILQKLPKKKLQIIIVTSPTLTTTECRKTIEQLKVAYKENIEVLEQRRPKIGGAIQDAFDIACGKYTVLMASDLETDPAILPELISALDSGVSIATTTRWRGGMRFIGYHPIKLIFNFLFQFGFRILFATRLTDLTYAYRAYNTSILKEIRWEEYGFPFLFETIVKPLRLGYSVTEINAPWKARTEGVSHATTSQVIAYVKLGLRVRFMPKHKIRYTAEHE